MTRAYLLLLEILEDDDIYVDHINNGFNITYNKEKIIIKVEDVKDFITIFKEENDELLKQLNIAKNGK